MLFKFIERLITHRRGRVRWQYLVALLAHKSINSSTGRKFQTDMSVCMWHTLRDLLFNSNTTEPLEIPPEARSLIEMRKLSLPGE